MSLRVELKPECAPDVKADILRQMATQLRDKVGVRMDIQEAPVGSLPRFDFKARRWNDERVKKLGEVKF